jgi:hypothetical protein
MESKKKLENEDKNAHDIPSIPTSALSTRQGKEKSLKEESISKSGFSSPFLGAGVLALD